jgi:hypothetical protein
MNLVHPRCQREKIAFAGRKRLLATPPGQLWLDLGLHCLGNRTGGCRRSRFSSQPRSGTHTRSKLPARLWRFSSQVILLAPMVGLLIFLGRRDPILL